LGDWGSIPSLGMVFSAIWGQRLQVLEFKSRTPDSQPLPLGHDNNKEIYFQRIKSHCCLGKKENLMKGFCFWPPKCHSKVFMQNDLGLMFF